MPDLVTMYRDGDRAAYHRKLRPAEVLISYDQKHWVYDLSGYGKGALKEFRDWASCHFNGESDISWVGGTGVLMQFRLWIGWGAGKTNFHYVNRPEDAAEMVRAGIAEGSTMLGLEEHEDGHMSDGWHEWYASGGDDFEDAFDLRDV